MPTDLNVTVGALLLGVLITAVCVSFFPTRCPILTVFHPFVMPWRRLQRVRDHHHADIPLLHSLPEGPMVDACYGEQSTQ